MKPDPTPFTGGDEVAVGTHNALGHAVAHARRRDVREARAAVVRDEHEATSVAQRLILADHHDAIVPHANAARPGAARRPSYEGSHVDLVPVAGHVRRAARDEDLAVVRILIL